MDFETWWKEKIKDDLGGSPPILVEAIKELAREAWVRGSKETYEQVELPLP